MVIIDNPHWIGIHVHNIFPSIVGTNGQAAIHNHANNIRTVGMGEMSVVMNGVNFRTRHNDYRLNMASRTSTEYAAYDPIDFPDVPPSVSALSI